MFLSLAFVPPADVLEHLAAAIDVSTLRAEGLEIVPAAELHMSVTTFGNVPSGVVPQVAEAVRRASERWPAAPTVRLAGGAALEWPGDTSVWVTAQGDVEAMHDVARTIAPAVGRIGFAVDRRRFQPWLAVARVTAATELPSLERLLATLEAYAGPPWVAGELSLLRATFARGATERGYETVRTFPLPTP
jgi:RNA 2',3'-cyclic 3'-phosphodiesterase